MKWYNKSHYSRMLTDIGMDVKLQQEAERYVMRYAKLAFKFMRQVNLEEQKIGILNLQDIMQICFEGLIAAWVRVDWEKIESSDNWQKTLVNYLSSNIQGNLKRRVYQEATGVNVPEYQINKTKAEMIADGLFGRWLHSFRLDDILATSDKIIRYMDVIEYDPTRSSSFMNDELNNDLTTLMFKYLNDKERDIIRWSYGIDDDKLTSYEIGDRLGMNANAVRKAQSRAISKLKNEESEFILKDFL